MSVGNVLLGLLSRGPRHGYDLKREHDRLFPAAKPLPYGQVYATLSRLLRDGLVEVADTGPGQGPERTRYGLTPEGERSLRSWLGAVEEPARYVAPALFSKVVLALLSGESAEGYLRAQRAAHLERMRVLTREKSAPGAPLADVLACDYALLHLEADLRWIEVTAQRLEPLKTEVSR